MAAVSIYILIHTDIYIYAEDRAERQQRRVHGRSGGGRAVIYRIARDVPLEIRRGDDVLNGRVPVQISVSEWGHGIYHLLMPARATGQI